MMNASTTCLTISPHIVVVKATTDKGYITLVLSSAVEKLIEALKDFGLSEYEAKVLLTLIAKGELTAKEISEFSGVPRTSVYEVVRSLTNKGLVIASGKSCYCLFKTGFMKRPVGKTMLCKIMRSELFDLQR